MRKVLLLPDTPGWAYDIIAQNLVKHIDRARYIAEIKYVGHVLSGKTSVDFNNYDVVFAFFWYDMYSMEGKFYKNFDPRKVAVGVHGINSWEKRKIAIPDVKKILSRYKAVGGVSREICGIINSKHMAYTPSGFDLSTFKVKTMPIQPKNGGRLKLLWVGDPSIKHHGDIKGYNEFIRPAINSVNNVELITATKDNKIPYNEMPKFYEKGHVLLCLSKTEGSPLPVIEAMACGRPIISTKVGVVPELVNHGKNGFIVNRDIKSLTEAINNIRNKDLVLMGNEARKSVRDWTWERSAKAYQDLWDMV